MRELTGRDARGVLLICLDLQRANLNDEPVSWRVQDRAAACERLLAFARRAGWDIVHSHRVREADGRDDAPIPGFEPLPNEPVYFRHATSALSNPRLAEMVHGAREGEVLVAGFDLRTSGVATALDAFNQGLRLTLVKDAVWAAPREGAQAASEHALWDVVAPFAHVAGVESVLAETAQPLPVANDA
ncbi:MAG TPA: isochorismatase family protein [Caulobacteraceae bacterium]|jgi:nicotinamidase-related amidase|nr:isochorismatase family protein [Caulobacteraceae bacterium]